MNMIIIHFIFHKLYLTRYMPVRCTVDMNFVDIYSNMA